jgi:hypothetical protein
MLVEFGGKGERQENRFETNLAFCQNGFAKFAFEGLIP